VRVAEILIQRKRRRSVWPWLLGLVVLALLPLPFLANRGERQQVASQVPRRDTTARAVASAADSGATASDSGAAQPAGGTVVAAAPGASAGTPRGSAPAASEVAPSRTATTQTAAAERTAERTTATSAGTIAPAETPRAASPATSPASAAPSSAGPGSSSRDASFSRYTATTRAPTNERAHREYTAEALDRLAAELRALGANAAGVSVITAHADSLRMPNARGAAHPDYARAAFLGAVHQFDLLRARNRGRVNIARLRSAAWAIDAHRPLVAQRATVERFFAAARDALDSLSRRG
jgi:hypothetical protein